MASLVTSGNSSGNTIHALVQSLQSKKCDKQDELHEFFLDHKDWVRTSLAQTKDRLLNVQQQQQSAPGTARKMGLSCPPSTSKRLTRSAARMQKTAASFMGTDGAPTTKSVSRVQAWEATDEENRNPQLTMGAEVATLPSNRDVQRMTEAAGAVDSDAPGKRAVSQAKILPLSALQQLSDSMAVHPEEEMPSFIFPSLLQETPSLLTGQKTKSAFADCLREEGDQEMLSAFHPQEETLPEERMEVQEVGDDVDDDATEVQEDISDAHVEELEEDEEREGEEREEVGEEEEEREEATDSVMGTQLEQCEEEDDAEVEPVEEDQGVDEELAMEVEEQEEFDVPAGQSPHSKGAPVEEEDSATVRINGKRTSEEMEASVEEEEEDQEEEETADEYAREGGIVQETREKDPHEPPLKRSKRSVDAVSPSSTSMALDMLSPITRRESSFVSFASSRPKGDSTPGGRDSLEEPMEEDQGSPLVTMNSDSRELVVSNLEMVVDEDDEAMDGETATTTEDVTTAPESRLPRPATLSNLRGGAVTSFINREKKEGPGPAQNNLRKNIGKVAALEAAKQTKRLLEKKEEEKKQRKELLAQRMERFRKKEQEKEEKRQQEKEEQRRKREELFALSKKKQREEEQKRKELAQRRALEKKQQLEEIAQKRREQVERKQVAVLEKEEATEEGVQRLHGGQEAMGTRAEQPATESMKELPQTPQRPSPSPEKMNFQAKRQFFEDFASPKPVTPAAKIQEDSQKSQHLYSSAAAVAARMGAPAPASSQKYTAASVKASIEALKLEKQRQQQALLSSNATSQLQNLSNSKHVNGSGSSLSSSTLSSHSVATPSSESKSYPTLFPHKTSTPSSANNSISEEYEMTDREDNSFWSSSEDEDNGKPVPQWAKGPRIAAALERQKPVDPDQIFPAMPMSCDLEELFAPVSKPRYRRRFSSSRWSRDHFTPREEFLYKAAQGYKK